jgi:hypothetical protein
MAMRLESSMRPTRRGVRSLVIVKVVVVVVVVAVLDGNCIVGKGCGEIIIGWESR